MRFLIILLPILSFSFLHSQDNAVRLLSPNEVQSEVPANRERINNKDFSQERVLKSPISIDSVSNLESREYDQNINLSIESADRKKSYNEVITSDSLSRFQKKPQPHLIKSKKTK